MADTRLLLVGAGNMGRAMLAGWRVADYQSIGVIDPALTASDMPRGVTLNPPPDTPCDMLVLAVKPQIIAKIAGDILLHMDDKTCLISVMAGVSVTRLTDLFGARLMVRAMPNMPAAIGQGACGLFTPQDLGDRAAVEKLLAATGLCVWVEAEAQLDAVTALSGSGPAYIFYLVETLAEQGRALGLSDAVAQKLARQTVIGCGALLAARHESAGDLRAAVTSAGGTSEAALEILSGDDGLGALMGRAMAAALARAQELK